MYIQFVHGGALRETMQELFPGDVIRVEGELTFYNNISQFDPSSIELLGSISTDTEYADLGPLLEPQTVQLGDINIPSPEVEGAQRWNAENYSKYNHMYVKIEGLEVIARNESPTGRPWVALSDGTSILYTTDTSLRFRNDRGSSYGDNLNYKLPPTPCRAGRSLHASTSRRHCGHFRLYRGQHLQSGRFLTNQVHSPPLKLLPGMMVSYGLPTVKTPLTV